jgi:hypothetical protein
MDWSLVPSGVLVGFTPNVMISAQTGNGSSSGGGATRGVFASRPSCSSSGSTYYSTDISVVSECNGSTWADWGFGQPVVLPSLTTFSNQNTSGTTITYNGFGSIASPNAGGDSIRGQFISIPSTPFTIDACFAIQGYAQGTSIGYGLYQSDGTKLVTLQISHSTSLQAGELGVFNWNSVTSFNAAAFGTSDFAAGDNGHSCLRWNDNGTNVVTSWSSDAGFTWTQLGSVGRTAFLTPTQVGWYLDNFSSTTTTNVSITLISWFQH